MPQNNEDRLGWWCNDNKNNIDEKIHIFITSQMPPVTFFSFVQLGVHKLIGLLKNTHVCRSFCLQVWETYMTRKRNSYYPVMFPCLCQLFYNPRFWKTLSRNYVKYYVGTNVGHIFQENSSIRRLCNTNSSPDSSTHHSRIVVRCFGPIPASVTATLTPERSLWLY